MSKSIEEITKIIQDFRNARGWLEEDPNHLIASAFVELGELAEHYQWQSKFRKLTEIEKEEIGYEFVDVLFYLLTLASKSGIDVEKAFDSKLPKLAKKFPVDASDEDHKKAHKLYRKNGKNKLYD